MIFQRLFWPQIGSRTMKPIKFHEEMLTMIQEATTAPSSVNMQPWRFVVVESEAGKEN